MEMMAGPTSLGPAACRRSYSSSNTGGDGGGAGRRQKWGKMAVRATVTGRYVDGNQSAVGSLDFVACDGVKLSASLSDASLLDGLSLDGVELSLEKPGAFVLSYDVPNKDVRFQFMNTISIADKPLHMTYAHARKNNRTTLDGAFELDTANKISANYAFGSANCKVKYTYIHGDGSQTFEPCYDFAKNAWDFAVSQRIFEDDVIKASYQTSSKVLNVDWIRNFMASSSFKVSASLDLANELRMPKITTETIWNFDM